MMTIQKKRHEQIVNSFQVEWSQASLHVNLFRKEVDPPLRMPEAAEEILIDMTEPNMALAVEDFPQEIQLFKWCPGQPFIEIRLNVFRFFGGMSEALPEVEAIHLNGKIRVHTRSGKTQADGSGLL